MSPIVRGTATLHAVLVGVAAVLAVGILCKILVLVHLH